jgi:predicted nuclease with RNAse H fold
VPEKSVRPERFVGIDLASVPARTGAALITLVGVAPTRRAEASLVGENFVADDDALGALIDADTVVGLDAPLGWPDDFVRAVVAHHAFEPWPIARDEKRVRESLRLRRGDIFVRSLDLGSTPLSVSSDLIGVVAMRAALLQSSWAQPWGRLEPRDGSGRLVETYPAAALRSWKFLKRRGDGYKGGSKRDRDRESSERARMLAEIETASASWLKVDAALREEARLSDHVFDAFICALTALAAKASLTYSPPANDEDAALREGWIHVPRGLFTDLADAVPQL